MDLTYITDPSADVADDQKQVNYTVTFDQVTSDGQSVIFQVDFDDPGKVSTQGEFRDSMDIVINKRYFKELFVLPSGELLKFNQEQAQRIKYEISLPLQAPPASSQSFKVFKQ